MPSSVTSCTIFCRVIDNFGDAGVCWRLARQLVAEHDWQVTLVIDDPARLASLSPDADVVPINIIDWAHAADAAIPDVVIEAFACEPPPAFVARMCRRRAPPVWINLEYLSAEAWVDRCHRLCSPQPESGLRKYFYFPGFTERTGGLLREADYAFRQSAFDKGAFCTEFAIPEIEGETLVSYFAYPDAPYAALCDVFSAASAPMRLLLPGQTTPGHQHGNLVVQTLPWLSQRRYDELLWLCDLNFVRGEDSFVRAQWAAKPFLWQIYRQSDNAHLDKLNAFLDRYLAAKVGAGETALYRSAMHAWNTGGAFDWRRFAPHLPDYAQRARHWRAELWQQPDLATQLVEFCGKLRDGLE